jgi:hypothetical protein
VSELYEHVDVEFLHEVVRQYSGCEGDYSKLTEEIAQFNGGYMLVARYAGLWLRGRGCDASDVERAVEETKKEPKLFHARYIWHVLLRGSGDLARRVAVLPRGSGMLQDATDVFSGHRFSRSITRDV